MTDHPNDEFADNKKLSALYRAGSTAQPPVHIDQAILTQARHSVGPVPRHTHARWAVPLSVAAILVLSVSLISLIHKEAPTVSEISMDMPPPNAYITAPERAKSDMFAEQNTEAVTTKERPIQSPVVTARKEKSMNEAEISDRLAASAYSPTHIDETIEIPLPDSDAEQKPILKLLQGKPVPRPKMTDDGSESDSTSEKDRYSEKNKHCELLSHSACLDSKECSLLMAAQKTFVCSHSLNHCDSGFSQESDTKESCEAKKGCVHISEPCSCPSDVTCICDEDQLSQCRLLIQPMPE